MSPLTWPTWGKVVAVIVSLLVLLGIWASFILYQQLIQNTPEGFAKATEPVKMACLNYIEQLTQQRGSLEPLKSAASYFSIQNGHHSKLLQATFYTKTNPVHGRDFECTLGLAGTGYNVTQFKWTN